MARRSPPTTSSSASRAARADTSQLRVYANAAGMPKKIDDLTVEFTTSGPNPVELEHIATINIMTQGMVREEPRDQAAELHAEGGHDHRAPGQRHRARTCWRSREPDVKTVLNKNPNWWGIKAGLFEGNVDEVIYTPIVSDATRVAALISGEVDLVNDPPPQDVPRLAQTPGIKVLEGVENRVVFIGMDQHRDELLYSSVKGRNPFKDRRVRQALYQAIDIEAIKAATMRGLSKPTGAMLPSPEILDSRDREASAVRSRARRRSCLPKPAIPNGFEVTLDCPNNRYVNDEKICQALAAMWSQIGVTTKVNAMPRANYFPKLEKLDTSLYMLGWGGAATDPIFILQPVLSTLQRQGRRRLQLRPLHQPKLDALTAKIKIDMDPDDAAGPDPRGVARAHSRDRTTFRCTGR